MQYYVPQFIEMESKIIGPLTLKQFLIILVPVGIVALLFFIFKNMAIVFIFGGGLIGGGLFLAFSKYQGQDATALLFYGFTYFFNPHEYIWIKESESKIIIKEVKTAIEKKKEALPKVPIEESKLKMAAWSVQVKK